MAQVPQEYTSVVLGHKLSPRRAWEELGGAIIQDGKDVECEHLIGWLRIACTLQPNPTDVGQPLPPQNYLGLTATVYPPLDEDDDFQTHR